MAEPESVDLPYLAGNPVAGSQCIVTKGNWTGEPSHYSYEWRADLRSLNAQDKDTYVISSDAIGSMVSCAVTASNDDGEASATSNSIGPIVARPAGSPDGVTSAEEQRAKSAIIEHMGVENYKDADDDRKG